MYLSSGGTDSFCGTVKMSMIDSMKYIYAIARSLLEQGFRRQIYIPAHGPSKLLVHPVIQQLLDDTKVPMLLLEPHDLFSVKGVTPRRNMDFGARKFKPLSDEAGLGDHAWMLGAYKIIGRLNDVPTGAEANIEGTLGGEISSMTSTYLHDENVSWNELMRRTGVRLDMHAVADTSYAEQCKLAIASGTLDDITSVGANYAGGLDQAYDDGLFLCFDGHEDWIPNYMRWVNDSDMNRKAAYTDDGHLMALSQVYDRLEAGWCGYYIRQDWLDALKLAMPETIDEWTEVLTAFKTAYTGAEGPLDMCGTALQYSNYFCGAYDVAQSGLIKRDGKVEYCFVSDGFRAYAEQMHRWYADGLLDSDDVSNGAFMLEADRERLAADVVGAAHLIDTCSGTFYTDIGIAGPDCYFATTPVPSLKKGEPAQVRFKGDDAATMGSTGWMISTKCKNPELAARFLDYCYSDAGLILTNYGVEGDTFVYDEAGKPQFTDKYMHPPTLNTTGAQHWYLIHNNFILSVDRSEAAMSEEALKYNEYWGTPGTLNLSAAISYTSDESAEMSAIKSDLDVKYAETLNGWITGAEELNDDSWNAYLAAMEQIGWQRYLEIVQGAYDRWLAK